MPSCSSTRGVPRVILGLDTLHTKQPESWNLPWPGRWFYTFNHSIARERFGITVRLRALDEVLWDEPGVWQLGGAGLEHYKYTRCRAIVRTHVWFLLSKSSTYVDLVETTISKYHP